MENYEKEYSYSPAKAEAKNYFAKIFMYMGIALGWTAIVATGVFFLLAAGFIPIDVYEPLLIGASVLNIVIIFVIQFSVLRRQGQKSIAVPFGIYATTMGILLSTLMISYDLVTLATSFGISAVLFGAMALYGATTKQNLRPMGMVASMAFLGVFIISIINLIWFNETVYWIVSFASFGLILLITAYDVWRIQRHIESGTINNNIAMYYALQLYVDFIYILIRVSQFLGYARRR